MDWFHGSIFLSRDLYWYDMLHKIARITNQLFSFYLTLHVTFSGVESTILNVSSGAEMSSIARQLGDHFRKHGTPIMIGINHLQFSFSNSILISIIRLIALVLLLVLD